MWFELIVGAVAIVIAIFINKRINSSNNNGKPIASLQGYPIIGNMLFFFKGGAGTPLRINIYQVMVGYSKLFEKEDVYQIQMGPFNTYMLTKSKSVEVLLKSTEYLNKPVEYHFLDPWLGSGLITSDKDIWRIHRKMLTPSFHFKILEKYQPIIFKKTEILIGKFKEKLNGKPFPIAELIERCTMDVICETAMGYNINAQLDTNNAYIHSVNRMCTVMYQRFVTFYLRKDFVFNLSELGREFNRNLKVVQSFIKKIISDRKSEFLSKHKKGELHNSEEFVSQKQQPFLDILLKKHILEGELSEQDVLDEVNTFMFAGQDTTFAGAVWSLFLIGQHPDVQSKIADELFEVFGDDKEGPITIEQCKQLKYLECVIKETLRLYPSVPTVARNLDEDLHYDGKVLKKGSICHVFLQALHKDPDVFPNPEIFDPDRFLPENCVGRNPFAYIPFSAGPRNCVGQKFAMMEEKTILANILRNFEITSVDHASDVAIIAEITSKPAIPINLTIRLRT